MGSHPHPLGGALLAFCIRPALRTDRQTRCFQSGLRAVPVSYPPLRKQPGNEPAPRWPGLAQLNKYKVIPLDHGPSERTEVPRVFEKEKHVRTVFLQFVDEATHEAVKQPDLQDWAKRWIRKWVKNLEVPTLPEKAGEDADVFLDQQVKDMADYRPELFTLRDGKVFKVFPATTNAMSAATQ